jgi:Formamidopyrimidine-DNA glycosylase N-terminal domain
MPEGDSVFQTARRLHAVLAGHELSIADLRWPSLATADLVGDTTVEVVAVGKHILHRLASGRTLHSHLKMEGRWRVRPLDDRRGWGDPSVRAVLATHAYAAVGTQLGMFDLVATRDDHTLVGHLGPHVLGQSWDAERSDHARAACRYGRASPHPAVGQQGHVLADHHRQPGRGPAGLCPWPVRPAMSPLWDHDRGRAARRGRSSGLLLPHLPGGPVPGDRT